MQSAKEPPVGWVNPSNIWTYKQNKPTLVVRDLAQYGVPAAGAYAILMARGVFKWLAVRRDLIKLKDRWKGKLKQALAEQQGNGSSSQQYWKGYRKALEECRKDVRLLCHSERWRAPDFDGGAWKWMKTISPDGAGDISPQMRKELRLAHGHNKAETRAQDAQ